MSTAVAVVSVGCFGTPTSKVTTKRASPKVSNAPGVAVSPLAKPGTSSLKDPTPAPSKLPPKPSPTPTRAPTATPKVVVVPSVAPSLPPINLQPVAVNPISGFPGLETENYAVMSTTITAAEAVRFSVSDGSAAGFTLAAAPEGAPATSHAGDAHRKMRRAQGAWPAPPASRPTYQLQAAAPLVKGAVVDFYVITEFEEKNYQDVRINARVQEVGEHCYVVVDQTDLVGKSATKLQTRAKEIATTFDSTIYPTDTRLFGKEPNPGVDGDPRIFILLSSAVGNYGKDNTLGYFSQRDEYAPRPESAAIYQHSNVKEMIYVSSRIVASGSSDDYLGTIAHEFQHMINFNQKVLVGKNNESDELWIDEGMAMYAIEANGYGLKAGGAVLANHVKRYQQSSWEYSLTEWDKNPDGIGYGAVYLFMVYLADRFGESVIHDIVTSAKIGNANVNEVLSARGTGLTRVFHEWALANLLDGEPQNSDDRYGYKSLDMIGLNGKTRLIGFEKAGLRIPGGDVEDYRPFGFKIFELTRGVLAPKFSINAIGASGVQSRLILPPTN